MNAPVIADRPAAALQVTVALPGRLTGREREVFVLREAFSRGYREIAATLGLPEAACRQIHRRALRRIGGRRRAAAPAA